MPTLDAVAQKPLRCGKVYLFSSKTKFREKLKMKKAAFAASLNRTN
jgi:hypothetical protein